MFNRCVKGNLSRRISLNSKCFSSFKVAIVGSGPSSFYAAKYILEKAPVDTKVDIIEKLPMPFGLVRYGVAPDHQDVKTVMSTFHEIGNNPRVSYFGNVALGKDVSLDALMKNYSAVVLGTGASSDKILNVKNEELTEICDKHRYQSGNVDKSLSGGVLSARSFVNWYNGHPDYRWVGDELNCLKGITDVVIVGQGNVAIDCARVLINDPSIKLDKSDITDEALKCIQNSAIKKVTIVGRRGFVQASFTIKELRELSRLDECDLNLYQDEIDRSDTEASLLEVKNNRPKKRIVELMRKVAMETQSKLSGAEGGSKAKQIDIRFLLSPVEVVTDSGEEAVANGCRAQVKGLKVVHNSLTGGEGKQSVVPRLSDNNENVEEIIPCQLILRSVGYQSVPLPGFNIDWFDAKRNIINNNQGRVLNSAGETVAKLYATGWCKRGPSGIVGTNITDAKETVQCIVEDIEQNVVQAIDNPVDLTSLLPANTRVVNWNDYMVINGVENDRGLEKGKVRDKIVEIDEIWKHLDE